MALLLLYSLIAGVFSLVGGWLVLWRGDDCKKYMPTLLAFAAGAFLGAALLDVLPEALEMAEHPDEVMIWVVIGMMSFFVLERALMRFVHHRHDEPHQHHEHTESLPLLVLIGDSIHNILDGVVVGLAYLTDPTLGLVTAIGVAAHEIPQEIGDASILLNQGWDRRRILLVNLMQSLLTVPGVLLGFYAGKAFDDYLPYLLATTAGVFLYLAASDLIPEIHHLAGHRLFGRVVVPMIASLVLVGWLVSLTHAH